MLSLTFPVGEEVCVSSSMEPFRRAIMALLSWSSPAIPVWLETMFQQFPDGEFVHSPGVYQ